MAAGPVLRASAVGFAGASQAEVVVVRVAFCGPVTDRLGVVVIAERGLHEALSITALRG